MFGKIAAAGLALLAVSTSIGAANAATVYDGRWSLTISTTRSACDTYNFPVEIVNGNVSFPPAARALTGTAETPTPAPSARSSAPTHRRRAP